MGRAWRPSEVYSVPPDKFVKLVETLLVELGAHIYGFEIIDRPSGTEPEPEYEIKAITSVEAAGRRFLVLVNCKHSEQPVKCDEVRTLSQQIHAGEAQAGMIFTNQGVSPETIDCAAQLGVALICVADGETAFAPWSRPHPDDPEYIGLWASYEELIVEDACHDSISGIHRFSRIGGGLNQPSPLHDWLERMGKA